LTPKEFGLCVSAYNERMKREQEERMTLVYLSAYWQRVKRMPNLKELLGNGRPEREQTDEEMLREIRRINEMLGGEMMREGDV
jgi:hypothetical protein